MKTGYCKQNRDFQYLTNRRRTNLSANGNLNATHLFIREPYNSVEVAQSLYRQAPYASVDETPK
jgi:hypothetical protein